MNVKTHCAWGFQEKYVISLTHTLTRSQQVIHPDQIETVNDAYTPAEHGQH